MYNEKLPDQSLILRAVIENAIDGIITIDEKGIIESINPATTKLFGYTEKELYGKNISVLMPQPHKDAHDGYLKRYLETRVPRIIGIGREVTGKRKDGSIFPLRLAVSEVILGDRRIFTGLIHDLTAIKEAQQKIEKLNKELEQKVMDRTEELSLVVNKLLDHKTQLENQIQERESAEEALRESEQELKEALEKEKELSELKSRFVSMASHEFRTPLSTILSSIELIEAYKKEEQQVKREKHIGRVKSSVNYLNGVLNDFLSLSRLEEGKVLSKPEIFILNDFCMDILEDMKPLLKTGQTIDHESSNDALKVKLDKKFLRHIISNLVSNAIKYSEEGKAIKCTFNEEKDTLVIKIKDQGIGIPEEDQHHLFTRFFRAHNVENIKGTGLGLNIVRRYVDLLNGDITFESALGEGSTFTVSIPLNKTNL